MSLEALHLDLTKVKAFKTAPIKHPLTTQKEYSINEAIDIPIKAKVLARGRKILLEKEHDPFKIHRCENSNHMKNN